MSHPDKSGVPIKVGDTITSTFKMPHGFKRTIRGHVRELCVDDHIIVDLFQREENGQSRLTMPSTDATVIASVISQ